MKKVVLYSLLVLGALSLFPFSADAGRYRGFNSDDDEEITTAIGIRGWLSQADAKWRISFPYVTQAGQRGKVESELNFRNLDSPLAIATMGWKLPWLLSFDVFYGAGSTSGGKGTDTDRFKADSGGSVDFSKSQNSVDGDARLWGGNIYLNNARFAETKGGRWGAVLGFLHYQDNLTMTQGVQTVSVPFDGVTFPPVGPFAPTQVLNSTYDFTWNAVKAGVTRQGSLTKWLSYDVLLAAYPYVTYDGAGYWNLRAGNNPSDFRRTSPNFVQKSTKGYGYEAELGLAYHMTESAQISAGYRYFTLYVSDGTDTVYFASGATAESTLDWVTVARQGAYVELLVKF
jgi:hypothetical protein